MYTNLTHQFPFSEASKCGLKIRQAADNEVRDKINGC